MIMKKIFSSTVLISIVLVASWIVSSWYYGSKTEKKFKKLFHETTQISDKELYDVELLNYQKALFSAKARIRLSSHIPFIDRNINSLELDIKLQNGPFFIDKSGLSIGQSRWHITLEDGIQSDTEDNKPDFLVGLLPAIVHVDFTNKARYFLDGKDSKIQPTIQGTYDLQTGMNQGFLVLKGIDIDSFQGKIVAKKARLNYQYGNKQGNLTLDIPSLQFNQGQNLFESNLEGNSDISIKNKVLSGAIEINLKSKNNTSDYSIKNIATKLTFKGVSTSGLVDFNTAYEHFKTLHQQAVWQREENGEFPEGQDQIWQTYNQIEEFSYKLPKLLSSEVLSADSSLQFEGNVTSQSGVSSISGNIGRQYNIEGKDEMYKNRGGVYHPLNKDISDTNITTLNPNRSVSILQLFTSVLKGEANIQLDNDLFKIISKKTVIKSKEFKLNWKHNKLLMK